MKTDEVYYIELEFNPAASRICLWGYYASTDNYPNSVITEWQHFSTQYLHYYYHKMLLF